MKNGLMFLILLLSTSCSKSYYLLRDNEVDKKQLKEINLDDFIFYKREVFVDTMSKPFYKGYYSGANRSRYEIQFLLIEKKESDYRNVIQFNYIPPYIPKGQKEFVYNMIPFDDADLVNINFINYFQFGKLNQKQISFIRTKSTSLWKITNNSNEVIIDELTFLDRGKNKTVRPTDYLNNKPIYTRVNSPKILLHAYPGLPIACQYTDYLEKNILYYNTADNNVYFNFKNELNPYEDDTWIKFSSDRIKANYKP